MTTAFSSKNKKFALIGAAGYVAPRHMKAILETGNELVAALDPNDSVGILDSYFPNAAFFTEFERFDRFLEKMKREGEAIDYLSICSPNYLHDAHIRYGLKYGCDVICEKPLVLNPWNIEALESMENETSQRVYNILQLRLHKNVIALKNKMDARASQDKLKCQLTYITARGAWYYASWKGDDAKSGGIASNIGIHFFDMLQWIFGAVDNNEVHLNTHDRASGILSFEKAEVNWFLSTNYDLVPKTIKSQGNRTYRSILLEGEEFEFSDGFEDLHTQSYQHVLDGKGFGIDEVKTAVEIASSIRTLEPTEIKENFHPMVKENLAEHPFRKGSSK